MNDTAINICIYVFLWTYIHALIPLAYIPILRVRLLGLMVIVYVTIRNWGLQRHTEWRDAMEAGLSHCRGHVELTHQKNMKKQGDWVKGKCWDTGFLLPLASRGTQRPCSRSRKRPTRRRRNPTCGSVSSPLALSVCGASPIAWCFLLESSQVPASMAASLPWVCRGPFCAFFPSVTLSLPGSLLGVRGLPLLSDFYPCGAHPKVLKVAL